MKIFFLRYYFIQINSHKDISFIKIFFPVRAGGKLTARDPITSLNTAAPDCENNQERPASWGPNRGLPQTPQTTIAISY